MSDLKNLYFKKQSLIHQRKTLSNTIRLLILNFQIRRYIHISSKIQARKAYEETRKLLLSVFNIPKE